jgi:uncharacterized membrane protein YhaH (DUF805 family)
MDVDGIEPGVDFVKALDDQVARCVAFLAVIGPGWTDLRNTEGHRRIDQPNDYVRVEIEAALTRDIRVIPVLVDGARMPTAEELPDSLKPLSRRNAVTLSHNRFGAEVDDLARALLQALQLVPRSTVDQAVATREDKTPWLLKFLFSFEGRISRRSFGLGFFCLLGVSLLLLMSLAPVLGLDEMTALKFSNRTLLKVHAVATLPLLWPTAALFLKRLHDFGQGKGGLWPYLVVWVIWTTLLVIELGPVADYLAGLDWLLMLVFLVFVGCIRGTVGPNQFGPDPLGHGGSK